MNGLELSRKYYEEYGKQMLENDFPDICPFLCAGLFGSGSECAGFDDDISEDHDFEPGFCVFLPGEDVVDRRQEFLLERAYSKLPKEFNGYKRSLVSPVGGARRGVVRTADILIEKTGTSDGVLSYKEWLTIPEQSLFELTNGEIYFDNYGEITGIRERFSYYPEDIRKKKLAGQLLLMAQSGQYNYLRCFDHGETAAAQLAVFEFVKATVSAIFLLNGKYQPFYKWSFRAMRGLSILTGEEQGLEYLMTTDNSAENAMKKYDVIENISSEVIDELAKQGMTKAACGDLEKHAYSVNDSVQDAKVRNLHIFAGV